MPYYLTIRECSTLDSLYIRTMVGLLDPDVLSGTDPYSLDTVNTFVRQSITALLAFLMTNLRFPRLRASKLGEDESLVRDSVRDIERIRLTDETLATHQEHLELSLHIPDHVLIQTRLRSLPAIRSGCA